MRTIAPPLNSPTQHRARRQREGWPVASTSPRLDAVIGRAEGNCDGILPSLRGSAWMPPRREACQGDAAELDARLLPYLAGHSAAASQARPCHRLSGDGLSPAAVQQRSTATKPVRIVPREPEVANRERGWPPPRPACAKFGTKRPQAHTLSRAPEPAEESVERSRVV